MTYTTYETETPRTYTYDEMVKVYKAEIDKSEYTVFSDWLYDMIKTGIYVQNYTMQDAISELMADDQNGHWIHMESLSELVASLKYAESCYTDEYFFDGQIYRDVLAKLCK